MSSVEADLEDDAGLQPESYLDALAAHGWAAMPTLVIVSWSLLGIEAASVECERPFRWGANHLPLGKMCVVVAKNVELTLRTAATAVAAEPAAA